MKRKPFRPVLVVAALLVGLLAKAESPCKLCEEHQAEIREWHQKRIEKLKEENGWLSLAGFYWLKPGKNRMGSAPGNDIRLPDRAPKYLGTVSLRGKTATLKLAAGKKKTLRPDVDKVSVGSFTFLVIERGGRLALRLFDKQAKALRDFKGIDRFPAILRWKKFARFEPYQEPRKVTVTTAIQTTEEALVLGEVVFSHDGKEHRLVPTGQDEAGALFFAFGDQTNGQETYAGGRFLNVDAPKDGRVVLDFNKAVNPPRSFTPYATCPLPLEDNRLPFRVEAGEKKPGKV
jgi:uncharacterized protein (DUF1684 family)